MGGLGSLLTTTEIDFAAKQVLPRGVPVSKNENVPTSLIATLKVESAQAPSVIARLDQR